MSELSSRSRDKVVDPASALGEAVGKLVEDMVRDFVKEFAKKRGLRIKKGKVKDKFNVSWDIDILVYKGEDLVTIISPKSLKRPKHARDKSSWVVTAHNRLKGTYSSLGKTVTVLLGEGWTGPSKKLIETSCIKVVDAQRDVINDVLMEHGIQYQWKNKDTETPRRSWAKWQKLSEEEKETIKKDLGERSKFSEKVTKVLEEVAKDPNREKGKKGKIGEPPSLFCKELEQKAIFL